MISHHYHNFWSFVFWVWEFLLEVKWCASTVALGGVPLRNWILCFGISFQCSHWRYFFQVLMFPLANYQIIQKILEASYHRHSLFFLPSLLSMRFWQFLEKFNGNFDPNIIWLMYLCPIYFSILCSDHFQVIHKVW